MCERRACAAQMVQRRAIKWIFSSVRGIVLRPIEGKFALPRASPSVSLFKYHKGSIIAGRANVAIRVQRLQLCSRTGHVLGQKVIVLGREFDFKLQESVMSSIDILPPFASLNE